MKATGIVRKLDDLGRLVIPKEIRKSYKIKEGDSIEFFVNDNNQITIKKYMHLVEHDSKIKDMTHAFYDIFNTKLYFYGDDQLTMCDDEERELSKFALSQIKVYQIEIIKSLLLLEGDVDIVNVTLYPLVIDSEWIGTFILLLDNPTESMRSVIASYLKMLHR